MNRKLAASEEETKTALAAAAAAGTAGTAGAPPPSKPSQSSPSSPADPSPATAQSSPLTSSSSFPTTLPTITTTAAVITAAAITAITAGATTPWFQLQRFQTIRIQMTLSPSRILIILLILVLAFLGVYFHSQSLSRQTIGEREMWRATNEISLRGVVEFGRSGAITGGGSTRVAEFGSAGK